MIKLNERAMLVHLSISQWSGSKINSKTSRELCSMKGAKSDAATVVINYIPKDQLQPLRQKANQIRRIHNVWTRPWLDGGIRIIARKNIPIYDSRMKEAIDSYNKEANRWVKFVYPKILEKMPARLANLLDNQPMPSQLELQRKLSVRTGKYPVPNENDITIGGKEGEQLKKEVAESIQATLKQSMIDIWSELMSLVGKVQERLSDPDKKFKDSLIKNLAEFCERIKNENFTDDPQLENMRLEVIKKLAETDPQDLRENKMYRKAKAKKAGAILDSIRKIDLDLE